MFSPNKISRESQSKLTPQKTLSFRMYELEQIKRLKPLYPFLTQGQIKSKIKDQWRSLAQEEKSKYTKVILKRTNTKQSIKGLYSLDRKRKTITNNSNKKKKKIDECPTPEFVNSEKLHDFRAKHTEHYDPDFSDSLASQDEKREVPVCEWTKKGLATYQSFGSITERKTPEIVDDTPYKQPGILRNRESGSQQVTKGQVSFNSPADVYQLSDVNSDLFLGSDSSGLLLQRIDNFDTQLQETETVLDSDDDDDDGILITRRETDYKIENINIPIKDQDNNDMNEIYSFTDENQTKAVWNNKTVKEEIQIEEPDIKTQTNKRKSLNQRQPSQRKAKRAKKEYNNTNMDISNSETENDMMTDNLSETDKISDGKLEQEINIPAIEVFKSPLPETLKPAKVRKGRKKTKEEKKSAEMTTPVGSSSKLSQLVTPVISQNSSTGDNYTTPQMDEVLQQLMLEAANKAPQKKRQSAPNTADLEKLRALTAGRRVTRSLISAKEKIEKLSTELDKAPIPDIIRMDNHMEHILEEERDCNFMDPSGDARAASRQIKTDNKDTEKDVELDENNNKANKIHNKMRVEQTVCRAITGISNDLTGATVDRTDSTLQRSKNQDNSNLRIANSSLFYRPSLDQHVNDSFKSTSEDSSCGSQSTDSSWTPMTTSFQNTNPVLEKALRNLRCTVSNSPKLFETIDSSTSPGLLSPALSGISELSSASSISLLTDQDDELKNLATENKEIAENIQLQSGTARQKDLCEMFTDLTPPDQKTKGQYKTERLVTSGPVEASKNFEQLFHGGEDDYLFI